jgi:steroid delta-isomerase-like uncharacterized protein
MAQETAIDAAVAPIQAFNAKDWDRVVKMFASDIVFDEVPTHRVVHGVNEVLALMKGWAEAFPDANGTIESAVTAGNTVVLEITWRGTHTAPLRTGATEMPATGRQIEIRSCQVTEIREGVVAALRHYWDLMTMMQQLGAMSAAA